MRKKQLIPAAVLVLLVAALVALVGARFSSSVEKNAWSDLVVSAPVLIDEANGTLEGAEALLSTTVTSPDPMWSGELQSLTDETRALAAAFGEILQYTQEAPEVEEGPLAAKLDPLSLGEQMATSEIVAVVPSDYASQLRRYTDLRNGLQTAVGELERLLASAQPTT